MPNACAFSPCRTWRYQLSNQWGSPLGGQVVWIMLNPSTADEEAPDPTVTKCIRFSQNWGATWMTVLNCFAFRATEPRDMRAQSPEDRVGEKNDWWLRRVLRDSVAAEKRVILAWGNHADEIAGLTGAPRSREVLALLKELGIKPYALVINKGGAPKHPLYIPYSTVPIPFNHDTPWAPLGAPWGERTLF